MCESNITTRGDCMDILCIFVYESTVATHGDRVNPASMDRQTDCWVRTLNQHVPTGTLDTIVRQECAQYDARCDSK